MRSHETPTEASVHPAVGRGKDPIKQTTATTEKDTSYLTYPAKTGAANSATFIGTMDIPVMLAKERRPK